MNIQDSVYNQLTPYLNADKWWLALSGGLDSVVLLHILSCLKQRYKLPDIAAVHIHHGLQQIADSWPAHCQTLCDQFALPLQVLYVQVEQGASVEQGARLARYQAFDQLLQANHCLLTAHHLNDQAETLLFRALRGAGVLGLSAMRSVRQQGAGLLLRPLLQLSRAQLERYAEQHQLTWVDDPSNQSLDYDRNYLRQQVLPLLQARWPQALNSLGRVAQHMQQAQSLLDELAEQDIVAAKVKPLAWLDLPCLQLSALTRLSTQRQINALRYWLRDYTSLPDTAHWAGWHDLRDAAADAEPIWRLKNGCVRRFADDIYWLADDWLLEPELDRLIDRPQTLDLPHNGVLTIEGRLDPEVNYRLVYRQGGERLQLVNRGQRDLKRLLQEVKIPHFARARLPLLLANGQLIALANLPSLQTAQTQDIRLHWCAPKIKK